MYEMSIVENNDRKIMKRLSRAARAPVMRLIYRCSAVRPKKPRELNSFYTKAARYFPTKL